MRKAKENAERHCPICKKTENQRNAGKNRSGTQRCFCKDCKKYYTLNPKSREIPEEIRQQAIETYYAGVSGRGVGKIFNMSKANVYNWIKKNKDETATPPMFSYALFDLDGTLTDPSVGITNSIMYALSKMGYAVPPREELYRFIGPPLVPAFMKFIGMTEDVANRAVVLYREYFSVTGLFENTPYDGISALLAKLKNHGVTLAVATSKPEEFAVRILKHFNLFDYFTDVCGATMDGSISKKEDVIAHALHRLKISDSEKNSVIMIGDRFHDIEGACENGLVSAGVLWGFGNRDELVDAGANHIAQNFDELSKIILA